MENEKLIEMRDILRETADIIDEMLILGEREDKGEDVQKESVTVLGRFIMKMIKLSQLQG